MDTKKGNTSEKFNTYSEKHLQNRISAYKLKENEIEQIWDTIKERDETLKATKEEHKKFRAANVQKEEIKLIKEYEAKLDLGQKAPAHNFKNFKITANHNVDRQEWEAQKHVKNKANQKIDQVLSNAREQGRGPENSQNRENQQENQQNRG